MKNTRKPIRRRWQTHSTLRQYLPTSSGRGKAGRKSIFETGLVALRVVMVGYGRVFQGIGTRQFPREINEISYIR
ncbi:hypothetical protein B9Z55_019453 [Caenorhabditis nigoni]|nr:hypothetical protein B9Z55_019453 [Caenorhabditis nigoni]